MLSKETVEKVAHLARLKLSESEIVSFSQQLGGILQHLDEISKIDTSNVQPLLTPIEIAPTLREDKVEHLIGVEELMKNAPEKSGHLFKVPPVV